MFHSEFVEFTYFEIIIDPSWSLGVHIFRNNINLQPVYVKAHRPNKYHVDAVDNFLKQAYSRLEDRTDMALSMQGKTTVPGATKPLPSVDPSLVAACKAKNPKFGSGKVGMK